MGNQAGTPEPEHFTIEIKSREGGVRLKKETAELQ
jgi:hypothetical protein